MKRPMLLLGAAIAVSLAGWGTAGGQESNPASRLGALQDTYDRELAKLEGDRNAVQLQWEDRYLAALSNRIAALQQAGDLDGLLRARKSLDAFTPARDLHAAADGGDATADAARKRCLEAAEAADMLWAQGVAKLTAQYDAALEKLQETLTKAGQIDDAIRVKAVREEAQKGKALSEARAVLAAAPRPAPPPAAPTPPAAPAAAAAEPGWIPLFDGKSLQGWRALGEGRRMFSVEDGALKASGGRGLLFYVGTANRGWFGNFELKAKVKTTPGANSGIYFRTAPDDKDKPDQGQEVQILSPEVKAPYGMGALYDVSPASKEPPFANNAWVDVELRAMGRKIDVAVGGVKTVDLLLPESSAAPAVRKKESLETRSVKRMVGAMVQQDPPPKESTFALQAHTGTVYFKDILVRPLP